MPAPLDPLLAHAARHHGLITRSQARALDLSPAAIDQRVRAGRLQVVARGVYRVAGTPETWRGRLLAACLATGGVASHRSAGVMLGVPGIGAGRPEVSTARTHHSHRRDLRVHQSRDLDDARVRTIDAIPVTAGDRLAVDLGAVLPEPRVEAIIQELVRLRETTWDEVAVAVMRHSRRGRDGVGVARRIVERRMDGMVGDSPLESLMLAAIFDAGLPSPELQVEVADEEGFVARVDAAWPDRGVIVEADGKAFHLTEAAFEADRVKRNRLRAAGWIVLEATSRMLLDDRRRFLRALEGALAARPPGSFRSGAL